MDSPGTTIDCTTESDTTMRIIATGAEYTPPPPDSSQISPYLDPAVISTGFQDDGQSNITGPGQGLSSFYRLH